MRVANYGPPLARAALRVLNGGSANLVVAAASPLRHRATRNATGFAMPQPVSQGRQPGSPPRTNASVWSSRTPRPPRDCMVDHSVMLTLAARISRKRQPLWRSRSLSTRASDPANAKSDGGGLGNNGRGQDDEGTCWKCDLTVAEREYFCECGAVQPLDGRLDYFEMLGTPPAVFLDLKEVERQFKNMQRAFHPDLFANKCQDEQAISAANSATANKAYQTLVRPMPRVKYLMSTRGSRALEEGDDTRPVPPDFLMEIMETRESLEECESTDEAERLLTEATAAIDECLRGMDKALKAGGDGHELEDAAVRLRYLHRIQDEARSVMHRLEDERSRPSTG